MENRVVLESQGLNRVVEGKVLVDNLSVQIAAGEIFAVTGSSGSGKSSFLRLLNRLDEPTGGTVLLQGADYRNLPPQELRRKVGMVTQRAFLFPGTVAGNLRFGPRQYGVDLSEGEVSALLEKVGLPGYAGRDVSHLSGGEAQRVSVARAVANSPIVLLLDEPTSALDEAAKVGIESLLRNLIRQDGLTCVLVTHDVAQASRLAGRIMVIEAGRMVKIGGPVEVLRAQSDFA